MKMKYLVLGASYFVLCASTVRGATTAPAGAVVGWWRFNDASNPGKDSSEYGNDLVSFDSDVSRVESDTGYTTKGCYDGSGCLYIGTAGNKASCTAKAIWDTSGFGFTYLMRSRNQGGSIYVAPSIIVDDEVSKVTEEISDTTMWHLIAVRYDNQKVTGSTSKYYYWLFGDDPTLSVANGLAQAVSDSAGYFPISTGIAIGGEIGAKVGFTSKKMNYKAYIDDFVVVARTLSKNEIKYYYHTGDPNPYLTSDSDTAFNASSGWSCSSESLGYGPHNLPGADFVVDNGRTLKALAAHDGTTFGGHSVILGRLAPLMSVVDNTQKAGVVGNLDQQASVTIPDLRLNSGTITAASGKTLTVTKLAINAPASTPYVLSAAGDFALNVGEDTTGSGVLAKTGAGKLTVSKWAGTAKLRLAAGSVKTPRLDGYTGGTVIVDGDAVTFTGADTLSGTIQVRYDGTIAAAEATYPVLNAPTLTSAGQVAINAAIPEKYEGAPKLENGVVSLVVTKKVAPLPDEDKGAKPVLLWQ